MIEILKEKWFRFEYGVVYITCYKWLQRKMAKYDAWNLNDNTIEYLQQRLLLIYKSNTLGIPQDIYDSVVETEGCDCNCKNFSIIERKAKEVWKEVIWDMLIGLSAYKKLYLRLNKISVTKEKRYEKRFQESWKLIGRYIEYLYN